MLLLLLLLSFFALSANAADCFPNPISIPIGNVTLSNGFVARGVEGSVGTPPQPFAFLPQWPANSTFVFGLSGFCDTTYSQQSCITFRGGQYSSLESTSRRALETAANVEGDGYPSFDVFSDTLSLKDGIELDNFTTGTPLSDWGQQGYHPRAALGLGTQSSLLQTLRSTGKIASRSWSFFWGRTGASSATQLDGSLVFGGYDQAKVLGQNYTNELSSTDVCSTGILVTISDLILNFPNGTDASLFAGKSTLLQSCIVPDYPVLMTIPLNPYFDTFKSLTNTSINERTLGLNYFSMLYSDGDIPYNGDFTFKFDSGLSVRIPNDQLVVPDLTYASSGEIVANGSKPNLVLLPVQGVNANDLIQLGRQFLSAAYLMVNQEAETYTLWVANPTADEDLVPVDGTNTVQKGTDESCSAVPTVSSPTGTSSSSPGGASKSGLSGGAIGGVVVGSVAGLALIAALVMFLLRRRHAWKGGLDTPAMEPAPRSHGTVPSELHTSPVRSELYSDGQGDKWPVSYHLPQPPQYASELQG